MKIIHNNRKLFKYSYVLNTTLFLCYIGKASFGIQSGWEERKGNLTLFHHLGLELQRGS